MFVRMSVIDYVYARRRMSLSLSLSLNLNKLTDKDLTLKNTKEVIFLLENRINPNFCKNRLCKICAKEAFRIVIWLFLNYFVRVKN